LNQQQQRGRHADIRSTNPTEDEGSGCLKLLRDRTSFEEQGGICESLRSEGCEERRYDDKQRVGS